MQKGYYIADMIFALLKFHYLKTNQERNMYINLKSGKIVVAIVGILSWDI